MLCYTTKKGLKAMINFHDYPLVNKITNRHIARCMSNIEPLDDCRKREIKECFRWLASDLTEEMNEDERSNQNGNHRESE